MDRRRILPLIILALSASSLGAATSLVVDHIDIPQVDYEPAIYYDEGDPLPHLDFERIDWKRIVAKRHRRVVLESDYVRVEVLPEMGRVYSLIDKRTGHDALWKNDIVRPGGATTPLAGGSGSAGSSTRFRATSTARPSRYLGRGRS